MDYVSQCLCHSLVHNNAGAVGVSYDTSPMHTLHTTRISEIEHLLSQLPANQHDNGAPEQLPCYEEELLNLERCIRANSSTPEQFAAMQSFSMLVALWLTHIRRHIDTAVEERTRELRAAYNDLQQEYERLREESIRDPLTSLFNRRFLDEALERELSHAVRHQRPIGIIVIDIDHFKCFNDTYGHDMGDAVLRALGSFLQCNIRGSDLACRFGGEEFVVILPEATLESTLKRSEELLDGIRTIRLEYRDQVVGPVTASMGVASFPSHGTSAGDLFHAADQALYRAKGAGRNRIEVAQPDQANDSMSTEEPCYAYVVGGDTTYV